MVKTLNYVREPRDTGKTNSMIKSKATTTSPGLSPRKRKARGMFVNDNSKTNAPSEVVVASDIKSPQNQVIHFLVFSPSNDKVKGKGHDNSITSATEHELLEQITKGIPSLCFSNY